MNAPIELPALKIKERPILFSAPMVRAVLDDSKTQTRRVIKKQPTPSNGKNKYEFNNYTDDEGINSFWTNKGFWHARCPYGKIGQRLWVRETFTKIEDDSGFGCIEYKASCKNPESLIWKSGLYMPRWASRIMLEITNVRVEHLNDISEEDCWAEGIEEVIHYFDDVSQINMANRLGLPIEDAKPLYAQLWESINGQGSWDLNPWVWCLTFRVVK